MKARANQRVLILDDEPFQRLVLRTGLKQAGFVEIEHAADADAALDHAARCPPDLVISDIKMPGRDGIDMLRGLQQIAPDATVVIVSALPESVLGAIARMIRARGVRLVAALQKPIDLPALLRVVSRADTAPAKAPEAVILPLADDILMAALRERRFLPYFEPKISTLTGRVVGFEALARLRGEDGQLIGPGRFVSRLEALDKMEEFTLAIFDQALQSMVGWMAQRPQLTLSVNVSPQSLQKERFAADLVSRPLAYGVPPENVIIEITESAPLLDLGDSLESLVRLRMAGFHLAIDDFGTGYASMQQLSQAPFTDLKIDREFTQLLSGRPEAAAAFESCMAIARKFGLRVCAEGIETPAALRQAADLGAHELQGWLIQAAMPAADVPACLDRFDSGQQYRDWYASPTGADR